MKRLNLHRQRDFITVTVTFTIVLLLSVGLPSIHGESAKPSHPPQDNHMLGEQMYRKGILPSGGPMMAFFKGDLPVPGTTFSCVSCHLQSGIGSNEGGVFTPPTNGTILFKPFQVNFKGVENKYSSSLPRRPAYTDKSLAEVIRSGKSPAGGVLNDVMPRYMLENGDMEILISYLKTLSAQFSPGVTDTTLHFATVIAEDVPVDVRDTMLAPLQQYINIKNSQAQAYEKPQGNKSRRMAEKMLVSKELATRRLELSQWVLRGSPETWRSQLEEYYRKGPVFALMGGITNQDWNIIHKFCEENKIPSLLPQTDFPIISDNDWYTIYPSKGYYQEGEAAANYLNSREDITPDKPIVQIVRESREGKALSEGFEQTWLNLERRPIVTVRLKGEDKITNDFIERLMTDEKPAAVFLWDGPDVQATLKFISAAKKRPEMVFVSSRYLGKHIRTLPENAREFTYITYPFSFAQELIGSSMGNILVEDDSKLSISLADFPDQDRSLNASNMSNSITQLLSMALMEMRGNYYRDNFFDVISMVPDQPSPQYGRLSFGPGQRYASKGCYIVQITKGPKPEIVRKSAWLIN